MGATPNTRLYGGEEVDPDLGLVNLRARQYNTGRGRFESPDSNFGDRLQPLTQNRYVYGRGDPAGWLDPSGHVAALEFALAVSAAAVPVIAINIAHGSTSFEAWCEVPAAGLGGGLIADAAAIAATGPVGVAAAVGGVTALALVCVVIQEDIDWHDMR
jgi:RHS repeat-associated protein